MASEEVLRKTLKNADGKPFAKYKGITNNFVLEDFEIIIDEVQNDKTGHTRMRVRVPMKAAGFPADTWDTPVRSMALRDLIARRFWESARTHARSPIPKTDGGEVYIPRPGQEVLDRGSVAITQYFVEVRFTADLPSVGGKVCAATTEALIFSRIATIVSESMFFSAYKQSKLYNHLHVTENAEHIRASLDGKGLVGFVAVGSVLPRRDDDLAPMVDAVPFDCDDSLKVTFDVPNGDPIVGMGIPRGFTVITGPGRNGKSCLADALFAGVYDHIPGDGREYVISVPDASFVMSEGGRPADSVDVSMFIGSIPEVQDTSAVLGASVSAPVSELVAVSEAVEMGSRMVIVDEEFSSPGVIRRGFLAGDDPITPLSEMGRSMGESGVSLVMVSGDATAIGLADRVILVNGFRASSTDVGKISSDAVYRRPADRYPVSKGIVYEKARKEVSVTAVSIRTVEIGEYKVNVPVAAFFDNAQTRMVADAAVVAKDLMDGSRSMLDVCTEALRIVTENDSSVENGDGMHHAYARPIDLAAVMNRHPQMLAIQKR
ncbi:MAG: P-loop domain-containing protein [Candidatus Methanomethylophilaceae archaeon]